MSAAEQVSEALAPGEAEELAKLERVIETGLTSFVEVGAALLRVRDGRLYRANFGTFQDYCEARWGLKRQVAYRMMDAAEVVQNLAIAESNKDLSPTGDILPQSERQARPLTSLEPAQQVEAWQEAVAASPSGKPTAAQVETAAAKHKRPKCPNCKSSYWAYCGKDYACPVCSYKEGEEITGKCPQCGRADWYRRDQERGNALWCRACRYGIIEPEPASMGTNQAAEDPEAQAPEPATEQPVEHLCRSCGVAEPLEDLYFCEYCNPDAVKAAWERGEPVAGWDEPPSEPQPEAVTVSEPELAAEPDPVRDRMAVHYSSETPEWYTPSVVLHRVFNLFGAIDLDPCSNSHEKPNVPARRHYTREDDGLALRWEGKVYCNPPYGDEIGDWVAKAIEEYNSGGGRVEIVMLVPARPGSKWFVALSEYAVCFVNGRLKFSGAETGAPFPSALFYLGLEAQKFYSEFRDIGRVFCPADWYFKRPGTVAP